MIRNEEQEIHPLFNPDSGKISFFDIKDQTTGFLSNYFPSPFTLDKKVWPSVAHFFMAQKFTNPIHQEHIRTTPKATLAKSIAKKLESNHSNIRTEWIQIRESLLQDAMAAKYDQNSELRKLLLETGDKYLEFTSKDPWEGIGGDGKGKNIIGLISMELRSKWNDFEKKRK